MNLNTLNEKQKEAVLHKDGPIRVIAGPGSGKTRVLTHRIAYLIAEYGIKPENILAVTFTRKAAGEMKEQINRLVGAALCGRPNEVNGQLNISTFHSLGLRILRAEYPQVNPRMKNFQVMDDNKKRGLLKELLGHKGLNLDVEPGLASANISRWKGELIQPKGLLGYLGELLPDFLKDQWQKVYQAYEKARVERCLLDYDDLLLATYQLFQEHRPILRKYQERFRYLLIDECQDSDLVQWEIMKLLAEPQRNLMIIYDEDQSIYSWRGARPEYVINFERAFPEAITIKLEQNYRSSRTIIETASRLISHNRLREHKELWTQNQPGARVELMEADDPDHEASLIAEEILALIQGDRSKVIGEREKASSSTHHLTPNTHHLSPKDIAILYRTNAQSRALEDQLIAHRIPYVVVRSLGFYDRREIKDIVAYLRLIHDPGDDEALVRIINVPPRYLGKAFLRELQELAFKKRTPLFEQLGVWDFSKPYMSKKSSEFKKLIQELRYDYKQRNLSVPALIRELRTRTDYDHYISEDEDPSPDDSRIQNLEELGEAALRFNRLEDFLYYVTEVQKQRARNRDTDHVNAVSLLTIHKAKGLEFDVVFVAGCSQGLLPHYKDLIEAENNPYMLEESRRLMYVAVTRAKNKLYLSYSQSYQGKTLDPSIFLSEMGLMSERVNDEVKR